MSGGRVLQVFPYYLAEGTGGASGVRDVIETTIRLTAPAWHHTVVVPARTSYTSSFEELGADVLELGRRHHLILRRSGGTRSLVVHAYELVIDVPRLASMIRKHGIEIVHSHSSAYLGGIAAARLARRPGILHVHERMDNLAPHVARAHRRISTALATELVLIAGFMAAEWADVAGRAHYIPNTALIDLSTTPTPRTEATVGFLGRIAPRKGIEFLLRAMAIVHAERPDARLAVVGGPAEPEDYAYLEELKREVDELGLDGAVEFGGPTDLVPETLRGFRVLGFTAPLDIAPVTLLQAMAAGVPVVSASSGGAEEMVVDGLTGFSVQPGDEQALAQRLLLLLGDDALRRRMGEAARSRFDEFFGPERYRSQIEALYLNSLRSAR
jgi:glycosyltransferase involved in cell wall biosynthesis